MHAQFFNVLMPTLCIKWLYECAFATTVKSLCSRLFQSFNGSFIFFRFVATTPKKDAQLLTFKNFHETQNYGVFYVFVTDDARCVIFKGFFNGHIEFD